MDLDSVIENAPDAPAVFAVFPAEGQPYLARTALLRRRLRRLFSPNAKVFSLRDIAERIDYAATGSSLENSLTFYEWVKRYFPGDWQKRLRLRYPAWVKLILSNPFPRTQVTTKLSASEATFFGPFRTRASAEQFEAQMLDLFQIRRCVEELDPSPRHPGCIYGEMNSCLRPCQQIVSPDEYRSEVARVQAFLDTGGASQLASVAAARDYASSAMDFEEAQRQHKRHERIEQVLKLRDELARPINGLSGIAVLPATEPTTVRLQMMWQGFWQPAVDFPLTGAGQSMDARLRDAINGIAPSRQGPAERQEHCALLSQWFYSTFGHASGTDGVWVSFSKINEIPYRRLVRAVSSVSQSPAMRPTPPAET